MPFLTWTWNVKAAVFPFCHSATSKVCGSRGVKEAFPATIKKNGFPEENPPAGTAKTTSRDQPCSGLYPVYLFHSKFL
ncbi:hypothetical protein, partial [Wandonia haliotis]|uniref:hypothetical protein n=1 Tax=Wandonia haliotis TaxID=574963 RepID=UPI0031D50F64